MPYIDVRDLKARAAGRWETILSRLAPTLEDALARPGKHVKCPIHGGKTGDGFRLFKDFAQTGGGVCNSCGTFPDGLALLAWATGQSFAEVLQEVADFVGAGPDKMPARPHAPPRPAAPAAPNLAAEDASIRARLNAVYRSAVAMSHEGSEPLRSYLRNRGLSLVPEMLRLHPGLHWSDTEGNRQGPFPTMIALVVDAQRRGVSIHRTYLTAEGRKAPVAEPKKLMSHPSDVSMRGAAIRLFPHGKVLGVAEGIETSIAVTEATGIPCWATITSTILPHFRPPADVQRLIVFGDKDRPTKLHPDGAGLAAARELVKRCWDAGVKASLAIPPGPIPEGAKGVDWLDVFVESGASGFKHLLAA